MQTLNALCAKLLQLGFVVLRQAVLSGDLEWAEAEVEFLHNVPSLIGEPNAKRHQYFWFVERKRYLDWVSAAGREEARSRMMTFYEPVLQEIDPVVIAFLQSKETYEELETNS